MRKFVLSNECPAGARIRANQQTSCRANIILQRHDYRKQPGILFAGPAMHRQAVARKFKQHSSACRYSKLVCARMLSQLHTQHPLMRSRDARWAKAH